MSFKILLVSFLVAVVNSKSCKLSEHIVKKEHKWKIDPPQNIYGNQSVDESHIRTWKETKDSKTKLEESINQQVNRELFAQYTYMSMAAHFSRDDNYLPGFAKFFRESAEEEHKHAMLFMEYQNKRGGRVKLNAIRHPCRDQWGNGLTAMKEALLLEKTIYQSLLDVHKVADDAKDPQMMDFLESNFLGEQIDAIKQLGNYIGTLSRLGDGLGEYQFDKVTLGGGK